MQETINDLEEAVTTLKTKAGQDEEVNQIIGKLTDKWEIMKLQIDSFKNKN
jgi:hypothetical protein